MFRKSGTGKWKTLPRQTFNQQMSRHESSSPGQPGRLQIAQNPLFLAEEIFAPYHLPPRGETSGWKLVISLSGAFEIQVGRRVNWVDPSRLLFIGPGREYADQHVIPNVGHASLVLTPGCELLAELDSRALEELADITRPCPLSLHLLCQRLRHAADALQLEELGVAIITAAVGSASSGFHCASNGLACVRRAKLLLHSRPTDRLGLNQVAAEVGVSPIYLTQAFKRAEGVSLSRYHRRLRLGLALSRLPDRDDITDLSLELGFSSHSHFTAAFRAELAMTPSAYRSEIQQGSRATAPWAY